MLLLLSRIHPNARWLTDESDLSVITIPDFLPVEQRNLLFDALTDNQQAFNYRVAAGRPITEAMYFSLNENRDFLTGSPVENMAELRMSLDSACQFYLEQVRNCLEALSEALRLDEFVPGDLPLDVVNGRKGLLSWPQNDASGTPYKLSYLYYMHSQPKAFDGGALQFHKSNSALPEGYDSDVIAKIEH